MAMAVDDVSFPLQCDGGTRAIGDRLSMRLLSLNGCTIEAGWSRLDMTSPYWRLYYNLDDGAEAWVADRPVRLRAGHVYAIPAWLAWAARCRGRVRHGNALIDLPALPQARVATACPTVMRLAAPGHPLASAWSDLLSDLAASRAPADLNAQARAHALCWQSLAAVFRAIGPPSSTLQAPLLDEPMLRVRDWIEARLDGPLPRAALARIAGCGEAALARRFAAAFGTAPARWIRQRRVAFAAELLRTTDESIDAIAEKCGLGDRSGFSRIFATWLGRPPAAYRRAARLG